MSRANSRATDNHLIFGMQQFKPEEFAGQIAQNMDNAWGIVRCIIDMLNREKDGKYVIMKDPNKVNQIYIEFKKDSIIKLYLFLFVIFNFTANDSIVRSSGKCIVRGRRR